MHPYSVLAIAAMLSLPQISMAINGIGEANLLQVVSQQANGLDSVFVGQKEIRFEAAFSPPQKFTPPYNFELIVTNGRRRLLPRLELPKIWPTDLNGNTDANQQIAGIIPKEWVQPGMSLTLRATDKKNTVIQKVWRPRVAPAITERVRLIPIQLDGVQATAPTATLVQDALTRLQPVSNITVSYDSTLTFSSQPSERLGPGRLTVEAMSRMLRSVDDRCWAINKPTLRGFNTAIKCVGIYPPGFQFHVREDFIFLGMGYIGGFVWVAPMLSAVDNAQVTTPYTGDSWLTSPALVWAHEYGHVLNLDHAPCGVTGGTDPRLVGDGSIGNDRGWDAVRGWRFSSDQAALQKKPAFHELMSYCGPAWTSARAYASALAYRGGLTRARLTGGGLWYRLNELNGYWQADRLESPPGSLQKTGLLANTPSQQSVTVWQQSVSQDINVVKPPYFVELPNDPTLKLLMLKGNIAISLP